LIGAAERKKGEKRDFYPFMTAPGRWPEKSVPKKGFLEGQTESTEDPPRKAANGE